MQIVAENPTEAVEDIDSVDDDRITVGHCVALLVLLFAVGRMVTFLLSTFGIF